MTNLKTINLIDPQILYIINSCQKTTWPGIFLNKQALLDPQKKTIIIIIGPSRSGKTTILNYLSQYYPRIKTATTRPKRIQEDEGQYIWIKEDPFYKFNNIQQAKEYIKKKYNLLEVNLYAGHLYGTPQSSLKQAFKNSHIALTTSENNGARELSKLVENLYNVVIIFILPDSIETLRKRTDVRNDMQTRLFIAEKEIEDSMNIAHYFIHNTEHNIYYDDTSVALYMTLNNSLALIRSIEKIYKS